MKFKFWKRTPKRHGAYDPLPMIHFFLRASGDCSHTYEMATCPECARLRKEMQGEGKK